MSATPRSSLLLAGAALALALCWPAPASAEGPTDKKLARLWKAKCSSCHGMDGKGDTEQGKKVSVGDMTRADWQKARTDQQMKDAILNGFKRETNGKKQEMEPFKDEVKPEQLEPLIAFVRSLAP